MVSDRSGHVRIGWIREDATHDDLMDILLPRIASDDITWLAPEDACHILKRVGLDGASHVTVTGIKKLDIRGSRGRRQRIHGHIRDEPLKPEAWMWRKVLLAFTAQPVQPHIVLICRDADGYAEARRAGFEQVARGMSWPFDVVLAMPDPEGEAWFVAGFVPADDAEHSRLAELTRALSFDPTTQPHRLTAHPNDAPTDSKRVLGHLTADVAERRDGCLAHPLDVLAARGEAIGLKRFIDDARAALREHLR